MRLTVLRGNSALRCVPGGADTYRRRTAVRIDHLLTGPSVVVAASRTDVGTGSGHCDLLATVDFRPK
jgi:hypothetical protein